MHRRRLGHGRRNHAPNQGSCPPTERHKQCGCARSHNQEHQQFKAAIAAIGAHLQPIFNPIHVIPPCISSDWGPTLSVYQGRRLRSNVRVVRQVYKAQYRPAPNRHSPVSRSVGCDSRSRARRATKFDRSRPVGSQNGQALGRVAPELAALPSRIRRTLTPSCDPCGLHCVRQLLARAVAPRWWQPARPRNTAWSNSPRSNTSTRSPLSRTCMC
jgi:hypothetical protein